MVFALIYGNCLGSGCCKVEAAARALRRFASSYNNSFDKLLEKAQCNQVTLQTGGFLMGPLCA